MISTDSSLNITVLRDLSFVDCYVVGLQFDLAKVRLFMEANLSPALERIGLHPHFQHLVVDFLNPQNLAVQVRKLEFPPLMRDPDKPEDFIPTDLGSFEFGELKLKETHLVDGVLGYDIEMPLAIGNVSFSFRGIHMRDFRLNDLV